MRSSTGTRERSARVVFLDFGGTLVRTGFSIPAPEPLAARLWSEALREHGQPFDPSELSAALARADVEFDGRIYQYLGRTSDFWRVHDERVMDLLRVGGDRVLLRASLEAAFWEASRGTPYPETTQALESLVASGRELGVISNHNETLVRILQYHGLYRFFRTVTFSQEVGAEKPDGRVFQRALARANVTPAEAVHVGDSWSADVVGARNAGIAPIWLDRDGAGADRDTLRITNLRELRPLLEANFR